MAPRRCGGGVMQVAPCLTGRWPNAAAMLACPRLAEAMGGPFRPFLELRLDLLRGADSAALEQLVAHFGPARLVVTCRGGAAGPPLATRGRLWRRAHALSVAYVDVDGEVWLADAALRRALLAPSAAGRGRPGVVVSWHHDAPVPALAALRRAYRAAVATGADAVKLACAVASASEAVPLMRLVAEVAVGGPGGGRAVPLLPLALGAAGSWSRLVLGRQRPLPPFTYCALAPGEGTAVGQPTLAQLVARAPLQLAPDTPMYAVMGAPIGQSRSPALHVRVLAAYGLPGSYVALEEWGAPGRLLRQLAPLLHLRGASVTAPHKVAARAVCGRRTALARGAGAVNTLLWRGREHAANVRPWAGGNTDGSALRREVWQLAGRTLRGRRCLVLGTGGTAAVALAALGAAGATLGVWGRRAASSATLARRFGAEAVAPGALEAVLGHTEVLVHCTAVGMVPNEAGCLLGSEALRRLPAGAAVFDAVYRPAETVLVRLARAQGLRAVGGSGMFLRQAQRQCVAFYGVRPPLARLRAWLDAE